MEAPISVRVQYVQFKRIIVVLETLLLLVTVLTLVLTEVSSLAFQLFVALQMGRLCAEIANNNHIQQFFNMREPWILFPIL